MATYYPASVFPTQFTNPDTGALASGFTLEAFLANTTTPTNMFTDKSGTVAGTVVTMNSGGWPEVSGTVVTIWLQVGIDYKFILKDDVSNTEWTLPDIAGVPRQSLAVADYAAIRALDSSTLTDGEIISPTNDGIAGDFVVKTGTVTDNGGTLIVFTDDINRYVERLYEDYVNVGWFGLTDDWDGSTGTDNLTAFTNAFALSAHIIVPPSVNGYYLGGKITKAVDDIHVSAYGAKIVIDGAQNESGFVFGSSATDSLPNHTGFVWEGGNLINADNTDVIDKQFILLAGIENFRISDVHLEGICNGGILLRSGCWSGLIEAVEIDSTSSHTTLRGIWLNGSDATDYATALVDEQSITRNATALPVGGIRNVTIRKCNIKIPVYNIYLMNSQYTVIDDNDLDIENGTLRNITINTYSPYTKVINNRINSSATTANKGVLITQYSHDVLIQGNTFTGDYGNAQTIHPTYLSKVDILDNTFNIDNSVPIIAEMGAYGRIAGNTFAKQIGSSKTSGDRCFRVYTIGNFEATQSNFGNTATVLNGWTFENNKIFKRNGGAQITQQADLDTANEVGIDAVIVKNNEFYNWDDVGNSDEYPLKIDSIASPANVVRYACHSNITIPAASGFEERNRADDPNGAAIDIAETAQDEQRGFGTWTLAVTDGSGDPNEGQTYSKNVATWFRIHNMVYLQASFVMSSLGTLTPGNNVEIHGLPFTSKNLTDGEWSIAVGRAEGLSVTAGVALSSYVVPNSKELRITKWSATTGTTNLTLAELTATGGMIISGCYEIESLAL